ncbi:MAG: hypothetical protein CMM01_09310 [Rhodopirellula sp.]|nr:hypothetical protein [Rhodopirellula sp.]
MTGLISAGILRVFNRIATTSQRSGRGLVAVGVTMCMISGSCWSQKISPVSAIPKPAVRNFPAAGGADRRQSGAASAFKTRPQEKLLNLTYAFGPEMGQIRQIPIGWKRERGVDYKTYVKIGMVRDNRGSADLEKFVRWFDGQLIYSSQWLKDQSPWNPHLNLLNHHLAIGWSILTNQVQKNPAALPPSPADVLFDRYLRVDLNGSGALVSSPILAANVSHQYRFGCRIRTDLVYNSARVEFVFGRFVSEEIHGSKQRRVLEELAVHSTPKVGGDTAWKTFLLPLVRPPAGTTHLVTRLIVRGRDDGLEDIQGSVGFDDIRIEEKPQLEITTDQPRGIYNIGDTVRASASIAGYLPAEINKVQFDLYDINRTLISSALTPIEREPLKPDAGNTLHRSRTQLDWEIPGLEAGYYRMKVGLAGGHDFQLSAHTTLAVVQDLGEHGRGLFGWNLEGQQEQIGAADFALWLSRLGVSWVKYPCWEPDNVARDELQALFEKLQDARIQTVGLINQPPPGHVEKFSELGGIVAAEVFRDPETWQAHLSPIMEHFSQKIKVWQLGGERDFSFLGSPRLPEQIEEIVDGLEERNGKKIDVALSWPWLEPSAPFASATWRATCRSSSPPLSARELDAFLEQSDREQADAGFAGPRTWLLIDPLDAKIYDRQTRIRDLVLRMATSRKHRVQAAFVARPHDPQFGLLRPDNRPGEMLLPWRTTSLLLGNLRAVGSMQLRSQARNQVYTNAKRAVVLIWADEVTEELAYFGDGVLMVDVWGRVTSLQTVDVGGQLMQRVPVGPEPVFLIGCDPAVLAFRMSVELGSDRLDSPLGREEVMKIAFTNPMQQSLVGQVRVIPPRSWRVTPPKKSWSLLSGQDADVDFQVVLSNTTDIGEYEVEIQFALETNPPELVSVYRKVQVGPAGIDMKIETRLLPDGRLRAELVINNKTKTPRLYNCFFFPPAGSFDQKQLAVPAGQEVRRGINLPDGAEMIGKRFRVRAVEQSDKRVMNYEVTITR